jgi:FKBP-type peptidyl-prolyl cis-trans isomerase
LSISFARPIKKDTKGQHLIHMKYILTSAAAALLLTINSCNSGSGVSDVKLATPADSVSYSLGMTIGQQLNDMDADINLSDIDYKMLLQGIKDQRDSSSAMELEEAGKYLDAEFQRRYNAQKENKNKPAADNYITEKKAQPGIQTTASGLLYEVAQQGTGQTAALGDTVVVHYKGTRIDGTTFDSSEGGEPAEFPIEPGMIEGWNEGMTLMPEGSKFTLYIPWELAYGAEGSRSIEPYTALIFDIDLIKVKKVKN